MALPTSTNDVTARKLGTVINSLWTKIKSTFVKKAGDTMTGRLTLEKPLSQVLIGTGIAASSSGSPTTYYPARWKYDLGIANPTQGDQMVIKLPCAGSDYGCFISTDNGTTYYPVARHVGANRHTTHYGNGSYICVVFEAYVDGNSNAGQVNDIFPAAGGTARTSLKIGCWRIINDYDSGNTICQLRTENGRFYAGSTGCSPYSLVCLDKAGKYSMLVSSGSGTGTSKTINTAGKFKLDAVILYYNHNSTAAANAIVPNTYQTFYAYHALDTRYSHNHTTTFTTNSPLYIECTIDSDGYWSPTTKCITQTLEAGKYYIYLGLTYSTEYQLSLFPSHPLYYYDGTNLTERPRLNNDDRTKLDGISAGANKVEASSTNGNIKIDGTETAVYTHPTQTAYSAKGSATKVPKITTDSTGHVTSIEEVTITGVTPASHSHGNIANGGTLTDTAAAAAGNDYVVIRDADNAKIQTSTIKGTDVADAVSKKHSHSTLTLSTTAQAYDGSHTLALPSTDPYTSARTPTSHTHGNITNGGALQTNDITIASGDKLVVTDSSDSNKVARASISFDGSTTTQALTKAGTWATFNNYSHPAGSAASKTGVPTADATPGFGGTFKVNQITTDATSHVSAVTERTITIPGTTATTSAKGLMSAADKTKLDREPITKNTSDVKVFCITKPITTNWYDNQTVHLYTGYVNGTGFELIIGVRQYSATTSAPLTNLSVTLYRETPYAITITPYYKVDGSNIVLAFVFANKTTFRVTSPVTDMSSNISTLDTWDETGWTALPSANLVHHYNAWKDTTSAIGSDAIPTYVAAGGKIKACTDDFLHDADITAGSTNGALSVNGSDITVYTHPTDAGNKHIPAGGSSGQFLAWDSAGTAKWVSNPNTNTVPSAYCDTAAGTAAKTATCTDYTATEKTYLHVLIKNANTYAGAFTLNVNGKGAKNVYINGSLTSASNYTLPAGTYIVYYDGTNYWFRTDGRIQAQITGSAGFADAVYDRSNQDGDGWYKMAESKLSPRANADVAAIWDVAAANAGGGIVYEKICLDVRFNSSGDGVVSRFVRTYESDWSSYLKFAVVVSGQGGSGNTQVQLWVWQSKAWRSVSIRQVAGNNWSLSKFNPDAWIYYSATTGGTTKPVADATNHISVTDSTNVHMRAASFIASGTLPVERGGTGAGTAAGAQYNLIDKATTDLGTMGDAVRIAIMTTAPSATNSVFAGYRTGSSLWSYIKGKMTSDTGVNISGNAATATKLGTADKGTSTKPIYLAAGVPTECSTYAGGTAVTLNNASKAGSTASFYAPTAGGTANYVLIGNGTTSAPTWAEKAPKASVADYVNMLHTNEVNFKNVPTSGNKERVWFNYRNGDTDAAGPDNLITAYYFGNRNLATTGVTLYAENFSGNASTATTATNSNKSKVSADTTHKLYIVGASAADGTQQELKSDTGIYATTTAGELNATQFKVNEHCTMQYNSTKSSLDFVFS